MFKMDTEKKNNVKTRGALFPRNENISSEASCKNRLPICDDTVDGFCSQSMERR